MDNEGFSTHAPVLSAAVSRFLGRSSGHVKGATLLAGKAVAALSVRKPLSTLLSSILQQLYLAAMIACVSLYCSHYSWPPQRKTTVLLLSHDYC